MIHVRNSKTRLPQEDIKRANLWLESRLKWMCIMSYAFVLLFVGVTQRTGLISFEFFGSTDSSSNENNIYSMTNIKKCELRPVWKFFRLFSFFEIEWKFFELFVTLMICDGQFLLKSNRICLEDYFFVQFVRISCRVVAMKWPVVVFSRNISLALIGIKNILDKFSLTFFDFYYSLVFLFYLSPYLFLAKLQCNSNF